MRILITGTVWLNTTWCFDMVNRRYKCMCSWVGYVPMDIIVMFITQFIYFV